MAELSAPLAGVLGPPDGPLGPGGLAPAARWSPPIPPSAEVLAVCRRAREAGGVALMVGGWVRDGLLGGVSKDEDLEVFGIGPEVFVAGEGRRGHAVGQSFGILKVGPVDVSFPRREGRRGAEVADWHGEVDPALPLVAAARRRDFTINALAWDPLAEALYDPAEGLADLRARLLRPVDEVSFAEDALRVLRAAGLAARLDLGLAPGLEALLAGLAPAAAACPVERRWAEVEKLLLRGRSPTLGWSLLRRVGALPAVGEALTLRPAEAWAPILAALTWLAATPADARLPELAVRLAVLLHGLPSGPVEALLTTLVRERALITLTTALLQHLPPHAPLPPADAPPGRLRRLALAVPLLPLARAAEALARGHGEPPTPADTLRRAADALGLAAGPPTPLVLGRDLAGRGLPPGPAMGATLARIFEAQLDGAFTDREGGLAWLDTHGEG